MFRSLARKAFALNINLNLRCNPVWTSEVFAAVSSHITAKVGGFSGEQEIALRDIMVTSMLHMRALTCDTASDLSKGRVGIRESVTHLLKAAMRQSVRDFEVNMAVMNPELELEIDIDDIMAGMRSSILASMTSRAGSYVQH